EVGVLLVDAGRDQHLPGAAVAVLDGVEQVGLAGPLVAEHRHDLGVRGRVVAVQVDDAEQLVALTGEQLGDVVAGADLVVGVAGEVVAERVAGTAEPLQGPVRERARSSGGGCHGFLPPVGVMKGNSPRTSYTDCVYGFTRIRTRQGKNRRAGET